MAAVELEPAPGTHKSVGQLVDVQGTSLGKGFTGTIKRHNFSSQRASHGNSRSHNVPGSISMAQDPGRVFPGKRMSGHMGDETVTVQNLDIIRDRRPQFIVVLAGDHVYKMDYSLLLTDHVERGAQCSVACIEVPVADASGFGVIAIDRSRRASEATGVIFVEENSDGPGVKRCRSKDGWNLKAA